MLPRWALGNWWSRYHPYSADEYLELLDTFDAERVPLSVAVLDMDWHWVDIDPRFGTGWTGYSWNRDLFPDPASFLAELHRRGLAVTLNVHPADGVRAFEDAYPQVAEDMGIDPASERAVAFDPTDPPSWTPTSGGSTTRWRTRVSTSGGWTGNRARSAARRAWIRCGC